MSDMNFEQQFAIRFCFRLEHSATEKFAKLRQAYGDSVLSRVQVFRWFKAFAEGRESIEDEPSSGRPLFQELMQMSTESSWQTEWLGQSWNLVTTLFNRYWAMNWGWEKSAQNWFQEASCRTKRTWGGTGALTFWNRLKMIPIFWNLSITSDKIWLFLYDPETKHTPSSPRPKKARMSKSKACRCAFFIAKKLFTKSLCHTPRG